MTAPATPLFLMKAALALLDEAGDGASLTACHLQAAIDAATGGAIDPVIYDRLVQRLASSPPCHGDDTAGAA